MRQPDQSEYDVRVEWGADGLSAVLAVSDVVVIIDVLSFSTCVDVAVARGALVFPVAEGADQARRLAAAVGATCAEPRGRGRFSLSPGTFVSVGPGERVVLPSPNGAALSVRTAQVPTLTACLRNAPAVARQAGSIGRRITVIAAGERWPSQTLRPALEDWLGAGAVVAGLDGRSSPEAEAARHGFEAAAGRLDQVLRECASGRELLERGFEEDVAIASAWNVSSCAPILRDGAFQPAGL